MQVREHVNANAMLLNQPGRQQSQPSRGIASIIKVNESNLESSGMVVIRPRWRQQQVV